MMTKMMIIRWIFAASEILSAGLLIGIGYWLYTRIRSLSAIYEKNRIDIEYLNKRLYKMENQINKIREQSHAKRGRPKKSQ